MACAAGLCAALAVDVRAAPRAKRASVRANALMTSANKTSVSLRLVRAWKPSALKGARVVELRVRGVVKGPRRFLGEGREVTARGAVIVIGPRVVIRRGRRRIGLAALRDGDRLVVVGRFLKRAEWRLSSARRRLPTFQASRIVIRGQAAVGIGASPGAQPPGGSPPPAICVPSQVWRNLAACGWAGPGAAGWPGGALTSTPGRRITADGTVIGGERISGGLVIAARNVTVRNSVISNSAGGANASAVVFVEAGASLTLERSTLDGMNATHACLWFEGVGPVTARANEMYGCNDGIFSWDGDNFLLEDNYLHGFTTQAANGHVDGFQTEGAVNGVIRHNTIDVAQDQTSAIAIWNSRRNSSGISVERNLLAGGGFTVYAEDYSPSEANPAGGYTVTNITFANNRFSTVHQGCVGLWGVWFNRGAPTDGWHRSGNAVLETGQNLDSGNPTVNGTLCR